jgi:Haemolymph juvenile hormone binding protein (JHBP)
LHIFLRIFSLSLFYFAEESTNTYLNENWRPVSDALKPIITKTIEDILLDLMQKIFHQIPGDFFVADLPKPSELIKTN